MKVTFLKTLFISTIICSQSVFLRGNDSTNYYISFKYKMDLSDTFGGGELFSGELSVFNSWYGGKMEFGHFQSQSIFVFKIPYEEIGKTLEINVPEMSIMKTGSINGFIRPVNKKWVTADLIFGVVYGKSRSLVLKDIEYEYNLTENRFTYLFKDYQLLKANHFGYQAGVDITFWVNKKIGFQLDGRIQDLSNGGTFFFVGAGLSLSL